MSSNSLHIQETAVLIFPNLHFLNYFDLTPRPCNDQCDLKPAVVNWRSEEQKQWEVREQNLSRWEVLNLLLCHFFLFYVVQFPNLMPVLVKSNKPHGQSIAGLLTIGCLLPFTMNCGILWVGCTGGSNSHYMLGYKYKSMKSHLIWCPVQQNNLIVILQYTKQQ